MHILDSYPPRQEGRGFQGYDFGDSYCSINLVI